MNYWLVKQEPEAYSFAQFLKDKKTLWTGVRNFQARNSLRAMKVGDSVFFYHSVSEKQVVGLAKVSKAAYPDPTAEEGDWSCVELQAVRAFSRPISLEAIKAHSFLKEMPLIRQSRLSVMPVSEKEAKALLAIADARA